MRQLKPMRISASPATAPRISIQALVLGCERPAEPDDRVDMRAAGEHLRRKPPHVGEGAVGELEPAVGAEHRDALLEGVQGLALHAHQRVVLRFEMDALGHVVEQVGQAALRIGIGDDAQRAAVGQVPPVSLRLDGADSPRARRLFQVAEVRLLGQLARRAQAVEDLAVRRPRVRGRPGRAPRAADRRRCGTRAAACASNIATAVGSWSSVRTCASHLPLQIGANRLEFRDVEGDAGAAAGRRLSITSSMRRQPGDHRADAGRERARRRDGCGPHSPARPRSSNSRPRALASSRSVASTAAQVGRIHPGEPAVGVAQPDRLRNGVEERLQGLEIGVDPVQRPLAARSSSRRSPVTSRRRSSARPLTGRPSASMKRPAPVAAA